MKEKIYLKIKTFFTEKKGVSFRIFLDDTLLITEKNYKKDMYETLFELDLTTGRHALIIEHFGKNPKDTILKENKIEKDIAIYLEEIKFNNIKCSPVDLHQNYFYLGDWTDKSVPKKINNNLYFGYNGSYKYFFESPATKYIINMYEKYSKESVVSNNDKINEDTFLEELENIKYF
jgi:hypothetical protein